MSSVLTVLWAWVFLDEGQVHERLLGASVMLVGSGLVAILGTSAMLSLHGEEENYIYSITHHYCTITVRFMFWWTVQYKWKVPAVLNGPTA